jgi:hypothetical protein
MDSSQIKSMTDNELIKRVEYLVLRERQLVECLIWHLREIQDRKLFIPMGYTSLFECLVKHFKYSEAVAYSRISALKILNEVPEAIQALNLGEVNLTTLSMTQSFIRKQEKEVGAKLPTEQKLEYLQNIKNKTTQQVKQILATMNPAKELPLDKVLYLDSNHVQIQVTANKSLLQKIEKMKELISHQNLNPSYSELLHLALDAAIEKIEKKKGLATTQGFAIKSESIRKSRYISRLVRRHILQRSQGQCEYIQKNGQRCLSRFQMQFDHIKAFSRGGTAEVKNIQHLCRVHNAAKGNHTAVNQ